jgi:hypothetical protein
MEYDKYFRKVGDLLFIKQQVNYEAKQTLSILSIHMIHKVSLISFGSLPAGT